MCGSAGVRGSADVPAAPATLRMLAQRGPDDEGLHRAARGVRGHRRLAIVGPTGGHQPLLSGPPASRASIANGETYNAPAVP